MSATHLMLSLSFFLFAFPAFANFELRAHYDVQSYDPALMNSGWSSAKFEQVKGAGADLIYSFGSNRFPLGIRYEKLDESVSGGGASRDIEHARISAVMGFRFWRFKSGYVGILGAVPISSKTTYSDSTSAIFKPESTKTSGLTAGIEAGFKFAKSLLVGAEVGHSTIAATDFKNQGLSDITYNSKKMEIDFAGLYYKVFFGLTY